MLKNTKLMTMLTSMMVFVGLAEPPIVNGKISFEEEAENKLKEALTKEVFEKAISAFNKDLEDSNSAEDMRASVLDILKEIEVPQAQLEKIVEDAKASGGNDVLAIVKSVKTELSAYKKENEK
jgi:cytochrome c-type biogenesis protein CcmH/NrfF